MPRLTPIDSLAECAGRSATEFVMHREAMLLLDTLVSARGDQTICEWLVAADDPFVDSDSGVPAYVGVEFMAQCVAVHAGVRARIVGLGPPLGFLLGARHFKASISHFQIGELYRAQCAELIRDDNGMGSYDCKILHGENVVADARLAVLEKRRGQKLTWLK